MTTDGLSGITDRAKTEIRSLCEKFQKKTGAAAIPAIVWIDEKLNEGKVVSGIGIAFYHSDKRSELGNDVRSVSGLDYVLAIPEDEGPKFASQVLDFQDRCFRLVRTASAILPA